MNTLRLVAFPYPRRVCVNGDDMRHCDHGLVRPQSGCVSFPVFLNPVRRRVQGCARVVYSILESKDDENVNAMTGDWVTVNVKIAT